MDKLTPLPTRNNVQFMPHTLVALMKGLLESSAHPVTRYAIRRWADLQDHLTNAGSLYGDITLDKYTRNYINNLSVKILDDILNQFPETIPPRHTTE